MRKLTTTHLVAWVWLFLAVGFAGEALRYIYLTFYQGDPGEPLRSKIIGLADGIPLAVLCFSIFFLRRGIIFRGPFVRILASVTVGLGLCFLGIGIFDIFESWPDPEKSLQPGSLVLITIGFVGYPLGVLMAAYRYWSQSLSMAGHRIRITSLPFFLCIGLHILELVLWWFWPFSQAFLYGAASLALFFAATNFTLLEQFN